MRRSWQTWSKALSTTKPTTIDTGGPSRVFWRLFVKEVSEKYCMGDVGMCLFLKNVPALEVCVCVCDVA